MATLKALADEFGVDVAELRRASNVGDENQTAEDAELTALQEQNVRNSWVQRTQDTPRS